MEKINKYDLPTVMNFAFTYRCNLRCKMCNNWSLDGNCNRKEMSAKEIVNIFNCYSAKFNIERVRFWGGEPFMRDDLTDIVKAISSLAQTEVITNGTLISRSIAKKIVECGLNLIEFSIDIPEEHNDYLRGKGIYRNAMKAIDILEEEKLRQKTKHPEIKIRPLITRKNYKHFRKLYDFAKRKGVGFRCVFLRDHYEALMKTCFEGTNIGYYQPGKNGREQNLEIANLTLSPKECKKVWSQFCDVEHDIETNWLVVKIKEAFRHLDYILGLVIYFDCSRSRNQLMIDPWGGLFVCEFLSYKYGNCLVDGPESWFSETHLNVRKKIIKGFFPICRECNRIGLYRPSLYYFIVRWYIYFLFRNRSLPNPKSIRWRIKL